MPDVIHQYRYVAIVKCDDQEGEQEYTVIVIDADKRRSIGTVKWYSNRHSFCFYPIGGAALPAQCLKEIADFIGEAMDAYAGAMIREGKE